MNILRIKWVILTALIVFSLTIFGLYVVISQPNSTDHLKSLQNYRSEEALYQALTSVFPNGTDRQNVERILLTQLGASISSETKRVGDRSIIKSHDEKVEGIYAVKYYISGKSESDIRNVVVRYGGDDNRVQGISVQIPHGKTPFLWYPHESVALTPAEVNNGGKNGN